MINSKDYITEQWENLGNSYWSNRTLRQKWTPTYMLFPELLHLIQRIPHSTILDYGCGDGYLAALLSEHLINSSIWAYDKSEQMCEIACEILEAKYVINMIGEKQFDVIYANMVMQDVVDPIEMLLEMKIHLNSHGRIIVTIPHPVLSLVETDHLTTRREIINASGYIGYNRYLYEETEKVLWDKENDDNWTYLFNRTLKTYSEIFYEAGLYIELISEPLPIKEGICEEDLYKTHSKFPHLLVFCLCSKN